MFFAYPGGSGECEMNMHVVDRQLAEPAGAGKLTTLTFSKHFTLASDAAW